VSAIEAFTDVVKLTTEGGGLANVTIVRSSIAVQIFDLSADDKSRWIGGSQIQFLIRDINSFNDTRQSTTIRPEIIEYNTTLDDILHSSNISNTEAVVILPDELFQQRKGK
jgi:hypothetical protein